MNPPLCEQATTRLLCGRGRGAAWGWLLGAILVLTLLGTPGRATETAKKPNILLILLDDSGYSDFGCYGSEIPTPNVDRLAREGVRFTRFFNASRCVPSRAALMTGNYNHLVGCPMMEGPGAKYDETTGQRIGPTSNGAILRETPSLGEIFRHNGYETWLVGKWHLGEVQKSQWPLQRGFDKFYGTLKGATPNKFDGSNMWEGNAEIPKPVPQGWFIGNAITDKALEYLRERDRSKPFFLYYSSLEPHWPFQAPEEDIEGVRGKYDEGYDVLRQRRFERGQELGIIPPGTTLLRANPYLLPWEKEKSRLPEWQVNGLLKTAEAYAGSIRNVDKNIGRLLEELERQGELDKTIILFLSDNGSEEPLVNKGFVLFPWQMLHNTPFRLHKTTQMLGGIATPLIVRWPRGGIPANRINSRQAGHVKDILGTLLEATGAEFPPTNLGLATQPPDSQSLLAALRDPDHAEPRTLFFEHNGHRAVMQGDWYANLIYNQLDIMPGERSFQDLPEHLGITPAQWRDFQARPKTGEWELYNLAEDFTASNNVAAEHPDIVSRLSGLFQDFWKTTKWAIREDMFQRQISRPPTSATH